MASRCCRHVRLILSISSWALIGRLIEASALAMPPHVSAHVEAGSRLVSVGLVLGVRGCPVPGQLERGDDIADGAGV